MNNEQDYLVYEIRPGGNVVEIIDIAVNSERRKGYGTKMINTLIESLKDKAPFHLYLFTRRSNQVARSFYESLGFRVITILPEFYLVKAVNGSLIKREDAVIYGRMIES